MSDGDVADEANEAIAPDIVVLSGSPDDLDMAAVTAVLTGALQELAADSIWREAGTSAWQKSQRALRTPRHPEAGEWRSFQA